MASVQNQTLKEIEIIVVNDASPDNAAEMLAEYAATDPRVKVITHEKNGGILAARLSGIAAAEGEYLIFLDADDYLDTDTARVCYAKARKTGADMIHFCFDVRVGHQKKLPFAKQVEKRLRPYNGTLLGRRVFEGAFNENLYRWNICGKCISAEVCRKAAAALPPGYYIMAEDFCFYSLMSWFATRYEPLFKKCYYYGLDIGVSSYIQVDFNGFIRNCSVFTALNAVKAFLTGQGEFSRYREAFEDQERKILDDLLDRWEYKLIQYDRTRGLEYMFAHYPADGLMRSFVSYFSGREGELAGLMGKTDFFRRGPASAEVRHVGVYVEPPVTGPELTDLLVCSAEEWRKAGLKTTLLCPEGTPEGRADMERISVPAGLVGSTVPEQIKRIGFWHELREKYGIDTVVHGAAETPAAIFDAFSIKLSGLNLVAVPQTGSHSLSTSSLGQLLAKMQTFRAADALAVLSDEAKTFYEGFGIPCRPLVCRPTAATGPDRIPDGRKKLLWLGNFGDSDAEIVVAAWSKIHGSFPGWKLCMTGYTAPGAALRGILALSDTLGISDTLEFRTVTDFRAVLRESALLFFTSGGIEPLYSVRAAEADVPCFNGSGLPPETLAEKLAGFMNGTPSGELRERIPAPEDGGLNLFDWKNPVPGPAAFPADDLLEELNRYRMNYEPYVLLPEARGATFVPIYRELDMLGYRLLPSKSPRRNFFFRAARYLLKRLHGKV